MRQYTEKKRKEIEKVFCNQCGKEIRKQGEMFVEDYLCVEKRWGYFSKKDNEGIALNCAKTVMISFVPLFGFLLT